MRASRSGLILVGAGSSERMAGIDKVWQPLAGKPLFMHSLERFHPQVVAIALVLRTDRIAEAEALLRRDWPVHLVAGGSSRQESVWHGLRALPHLDVIAVHDAARPLAPSALLRDGIKLVDSGACEGAIPAIPVADTIKLVDRRGEVRDTLDRSSLRTVQTPQVFRADSLIGAHTAAQHRDVTATDDAVLLEERGERVLTYPGVPQNFKVTTRLDLHFAEYVLTTMAVE